MNSKILVSRLCGFFALAEILLSPEGVDFQQNEFHFK